jgi:hypothetical protein
MQVLMERFVKAVFVSLASLVIMTAAGCSTTKILPPTNVGVLSAMQQRALNEATVRAVEQAGINEFFLGSDKIYIDVKAVGAADLGKQHVTGAVLAELETIGATTVKDPARANSIVSCFINVAGTDPADGEFLFWKWKDVKADVQLSFTKTTGQIVIKKQGVGKATYSETWFLGFGPETKIR